MPSIRQRFHLSPCSDFRSHFSNNYDAALTTFIAMYVISGVVMLFAPPPRNPASLRESM